MTDERDFSEIEMPVLNSLIPVLKPFEFEPKTNIGDINSSSSGSSSDDDRSSRPEVFCRGFRRWP